MLSPNFCGFTYSYTQLGSTGEYMLTGRNSSGLQQRCDKGCCRMSEAVSVARSGTLPAGVLEGADGFGLKAHGAPTCLDNSPTVHLSKSV